MALSADAFRDYRVTNNMTVETYSIKTSATVYLGSAAAFTTLGRVQAAAAATGLRPAGVIVEIVNDSGAAITAATGNTAGTVKAKVANGAEFLFSIKTAARTQINLGKNLFISDDDNLTDTTAAGTALVRVKFGKLTEFANTAKSSGWVAACVYGDADAV
jgi:hypothetical protein